MSEVIASQLVVQRSLQENLDLRAQMLELSEPIAQASELLIATLKQGGSIFLVGNGGSAADAQHIAAELVGRFEHDNCLPAMALTTDSSGVTALANDFGYDYVFSKQVQALVRPGDLLIAISTSGNSRSINLAAQAAHSKQAKVLGLSGKDGGQLAALCDQCLIVPSQRTCRIQEMHITIGHILCELVERAF